MTKPIRVTAIYHKDAPIKLYVLALIELARQLQKEEDQGNHGQRPEPKQRGTEGPAND